MTLVAASGTRFAKIKARRNDPRPEGYSGDCNSSEGVQPADWLIELKPGPGRNIGGTGIMLKNTDFKANASPRGTNVVIGRAQRLETQADEEKLIF